MRDLKVIACVDFMASMGETQEEEYAQIKKEMEILFPDANIIFNTIHNPAELIDKDYDIFILDFGGLMPGCDELINYTHRDTIRQIQRYENRLFIMWSTFTWRDFHYIVEDEFPQLVTFNVVFWDTSDFDGTFKKVRSFFNFPMPVPPSPHNNYHGNLINPKKL
jgi:hypothetical protein